MPRTCELPCYVINLDRSSDRLARFTAETAPLFSECHRVVAKDWVDVPTDVAAVWADEWNAAVANAVASGECEYHRRGTKCCWRRTYTSELVRRSRTYERHVASWYALHWSHREAIRRGLESGAERFFVAEDDASPRSFAAETNSPACDVGLWGSAPFASFKQDDVALASGKQPRWVSPMRRTDAMLATLTEYSRRAAELMLTVCPGQWDLVWWQVLKNLDVKMLKPMAVTQVGEPVRGNRHLPNASRYERC